MNRRRLQRRRRWLGWVGATCLIAASSAFAAEPVARGPTGARAPDAEETIETLHAALLGLMKRADSLGFDGRVSAITPVVGDVFDLAFMAQMSLGPHARKLDDEQRERWTKAFKQFVAGNYARTFDGYSGQNFETMSTREAPRGTLIVGTRLTREDDEDVDLDYRLREMGGEATSWKIIDVYSNGTVSELALRRSEFSSLYARVGFEELVETVQRQSETE